MNNAIAIRLVVMSCALLGLLGCPPPGGDTNVVVPNVVGLTEAEAQSSIISRGLALGTIVMQGSGTVPAGSVISQNPNAGATVASGSRVILVISSGPGVQIIPDFEGMTQSEAQETILEYGLIVGTITFQSSSTVPIGRVISQSPSGGLVEYGSAVSLVISSGPAPQVPVPNVVGQTQSAAQTAITAAELTVGAISMQSSSTVLAGRVISQNPASGTLANTGSSVSLVVSTGPALRTVPNLVGFDQTEAEELIADAELTVGAISEAYSAIVPFGAVVSQNPASGTLVALGSSVAMVISLGPEPILISNVTELQNIGNDVDFPLDGSYKLTRNIDASSAASSNGGLGFDPIGDNLNQFTGIFDGQGFQVTGLIVNRPSEDYVGLFGYIGVFGVVRDLHLVGATASGSDYVGGLVGYMTGAAVVNGCSVSGVVVGEDAVGGLIGANDGGSIGHSTASVEVSTSGSYAGGLIGWNDGAVFECTASASVAGGTSYGTYTGGLIGWNEQGEIDACEASGAVEGYEDVGGLVGGNEGTLVGCTASGNVSGRDGVGGLVGSHAGFLNRCFAVGSVQAFGYFSSAGGLVGGNYGGSLTTSYALGDVSSNDPYISAGGLVGYNDNTSLVAQCYSVGAVTGASSVGGLVGENDGTVSGSFWDKQASGLTVSAGGTGLNTVQMFSSVNFVSAGWDFVDVWGIDEGVSYPFLHEFDEE